MSTPKQNPEDYDADGIGKALRRDAQRIENAPFDLSLHSEGMAQLRTVSETNRLPFRLAFIPAMAMGSIALAALAIYFHPFPTKPAQESKAVAVVEVSATPHERDRASLWSYEMAMAQSDDAFSAALERDAQTLLPASSEMPGGLL